MTLQIEKFARRSKVGHFCSRANREILEATCWAVQDINCVGCNKYEKQVNFWHRKENVKNKEI